MPAHTRLKEREAGQGSLNEQGQVDFKGELLAKEMLHGVSGLTCKHCCKIDMLQA